MRIRLGQLRKLINEAGKRIGASAAYLKKEKVREEMQRFIISQISAGNVSDQASLDALVKDIELSMTALRSVPFDVWKKLAGNKV